MSLTLQRRKQESIEEGFWENSVQQYSNMRTITVLAGGNGLTESGPRSVFRRNPLSFLTFGFLAVYIPYLTT